MEARYVLLTKRTYVLSYRSTCFPKDHSFFTLSPLRIDLRCTTSRPVANPPLSLNMSRKAREDKTSWSVPSIYGFAGDYGPMKPPRGGIEEALVILVSTLADGKGGDCKTDERRHPMYSYAGQAQSLLLGDHCKFRHVVVVDVAGMVTGEDNPVRVLKELMQKELDSRELAKGFGKTLLRLFQRMQLRNVTLAAEGVMCPTLLKLCDALGEGHLPASDVWLLHPELPPKFVNSVLVPMGQCPANSNTCGRKDHSLPLQLHLVFEDELARDKRLGVAPGRGPPRLSQWNDRRRRS